jgi:site-specific recombinase XerD
MASIKLTLDTRKPRKDGTCPLKLGVTNNGHFQIHLGVYLLPEQWENGLVKMEDDRQQAKRLNAYIAARYQNAEAAMMRLRTLGELRHTSDADLKRLLNTDYVEKEDAPALFIDNYNRYVAALNKRSTADTYRNMLRKLSLFADTDRLAFEKMNFAWLKDFEVYMKRSGLSVNTISIYMRNIRTIFNDAIDRDIIPQNLYPFRKFKIAKEATRKRSLSIEQLRQLRDCSCEPAQAQYRDIFMLIFYLCGINLIDLCGLTETRDGYIEYRRAKTRRLYKIKVEPEALEIIERYRGEGHLLNILDRYADYRNYLHRLNKNLSEIGTTNILPGRGGKKEKTGLFPELSSYWARHSWATVAAGLDIPKETIAAALGHGGNTVTDIYIAFDQRKIDKANRQVLDAMK